MGRCVNVERRKNGHRNPEIGGRTTRIPPQKSIPKKKGKSPPAAAAGRNLWVSFKNNLWCVSCFVSLVRIHSAGLSYSILSGLGSSSGGSLPTGCTGGYSNSSPLGLSRDRTGEARAGPLSSFLSFHFSHFLTACSPNLWDFFAASALYMPETLRVLVIVMGRGLFFKRNELKIHSDMTKMLVFCENCLDI